MKNFNFTYKVLIVKFERKRWPLRRSRYTWDGDIKMYCKEMGYESVDWNEVV